MELHICMLVNGEVPTVCKVLCGAAGDPQVC